MKKCDYCGKEYDDDATVCAVDGHPLVKVTPQASKPKADRQSDLFPDLPAVSPKTEHDPAAGPPESTFIGRFVKWFLVGLFLGWIARQSGKSLGDLPIRDIPAFDYFLPCVIISAIIAAVLAWGGER